MKDCGGIKAQIIGTVIDLIGGANTGYCNKNRSKDPSEFLAYAEVILIKAAATGAIGGAVASIITVLLGAVFAACAAVIFVAALVIAGFIITAYLVDGVDNRFNIKESVADWVR